jgi:hypothetical protein
MCGNASHRCFSFNTLSRTGRTAPRRAAPRPDRDLRVCAQYRSNATVPPGLRTSFEFKLKYSYIISRKKL